MTKNKEQIIEIMDLSNALKPYENKWVALSPDRKSVVASGDTLGDAASKVDIKIRNEVAFSKVLPLGTNFAPSTA